MFFVVYDGLVSFEKAGGPDEQHDRRRPRRGRCRSRRTAARPTSSSCATGIKFSNGQTLTAADVVASFQRMFKVSNPNAGTLYNVIVGADACLKTPATCTLDGRRRRRREGEHRHLPPDPARRRVHGQARRAVRRDPARRHARQGSGHQAGAEHRPLHDRELRPEQADEAGAQSALQAVERDAQPEGYADEIDYDFGLSDEAEVTAIENGQADWMFNQPPTDRLGELGTRYAKQIHISPLFALLLLAMNTNLRAVQGRARRAQAVNFAIDRRATGQSRRRPAPGARRPARSCRPAFPAIEPYCPWTKNPGDDLDGARHGEGEGADAGIGRRPGTQVTLIVADRRSIARSAPICRAC